MSEKREKERERERERWRWGGGGGDAEVELDADADGRDRDRQWKGDSVAESRAHRPPGGSTILSASMRMPCQTSTRRTHSFKIVKCPPENKHSNTLR